MKRLARLVAVSVVLANGPVRAEDIGVAALTPQAAENASYELVLVEPSGRLRAQKHQFWLYGVELPSKMVCKDRDGRAWGCGTASFVHWSRLLGHGNVECKIRDAVRKAWSCSIEGKDVAAGLLRAGWGERDHSAREPSLDDAERAGREQKRGIWSSGPA